MGFRSSAWGGVLALAVSLGFGLSSAASADAPATLACPAPGNIGGAEAPPHWASPPAGNNQDKAPNPCAPCTDPANAAAKTCAVFRFLTSPACVGGTCADGQGEFAAHTIGVGRVFLQYDTRYRSPELYPKARGENCRVLLWAADPVIGVEDVGGYAGRNYWRDAYVASQTLVEPPFAPDGLALAIQPATTRSQHQFHIHIGTLQPAYRTALAHLPRRSARVAINGYDFRARFVPVPAGQAPFEGIDVFAVVREMLPRGAPDLPLYGVLATVTDGGEGIWILAAERFDRIELDYRQPVACRLR